MKIPFISTQPTHVPSPNALRRSLQIKIESLVSAHLPRITAALKRARDAERNHEVAFYAAVAHPDLPAFKGISAESIRLAWRRAANTRIDHERVFNNITDELGELRQTYALLDSTTGSTTALTNDDLSGGI